MSWSCKWFSVLEQGCPIVALESYCPAVLRCIPTPTQRNQIVLLPLQHAIKFSKGLITSHSFHSGVCRNKDATKSCRAVELEDYDWAQLV